MATEATSSPVQSEVPAVTETTSPSAQPEVQAMVESKSSSVQPATPAVEEPTSHPAAPAKEESTSSSIETSPPAINGETRPSPRRRHRSTAFFEPKLDDDDAADKDSPPLPKIEKESSTPEHTIPTPTIELSPPSTNHILFALPILILLFIYSLSPFTDLILSEYHHTTPLSPLLTSLSNLTTLSPALPYTGLATHILMRNLTASPDVSAELMTLAQQAKTLVEEFSGEEDIFQNGVFEGLEELRGVESWTEEGMREGYVDFFKGVEGEVGGLVNRTTELGGVLGKLKMEMGEFERLGKVVEWVETVFGGAEERYGDVLQEAKWGKERMRSAGKGWMSDGLLKREVIEIEKYRESEKLAGDFLEVISKEYMEGKTEGAVEAKLEAAMVEARMDWW